MHDREGRLARGDGEAPGEPLGVGSRGAAANGESFGEIFERYSRPVCGFLLGMLGDRAAAEEAMQETFIRAFRGQGAMRGGSVLSTWIFGIARNVALEELRSRRKRSRQVGLEEARLETLPDSALGPEQAMRDTEALQAVQSALGELTEDQRLVFVLKVLRQMRYEEIAAITGNSVAKLKTDLHRARVALRNRLQPYFGVLGVESAR
jgi:RNA polymerase sigma-70 factor, ECF subfamily